jgi:hypothetical protein
LIGVQSSEQLHASAQTAILSTEPCSKNAGETSIVIWITAREQRISTSYNLNQNRAALWQISSSNKNVPANRKTEFYANRDQNKQEVGFIFLHEAAQNFEVFSNIQECAADFSLLNLPKGKSLGRSKPATSSYAQSPKHTVWDDFYYIHALLN